MNVERWSTQALDEMRKIGDPDADAAVEKVDDIPGSVEQVSLLLSTLIQNDTSILAPDSKVPMPAAIRDFIQGHMALPRWADPAKIQLGQAVFMRHGPAALASLLCASLPECYSHKNGTQVLWYTQNLEEHTVRRVYQTALILLDVMRPPSQDGKEPGGLSAGGAGVLSAVKTRLFHAAMRHLILTRPGPDCPAPDPGARPNLAGELFHSDWNEAAWGKPINAEDAVFTLLTFSYVILRSWDRLGCKLSTEEREGYIHCWNVVGYFLGIPVEFLPTSWDDAKVGFEQLQKHQQASSPEGIKLTDALRTVIGKIVPSATLATHIDHTLMRFLMSDETADLLGVPHPDAMDHVITLGIQLARIANESLAAIGSILNAIRWPWGNHGSDGDPSNLGVMIGQAITELLVALVGRGEKGFDAGDIKAKAGEVVTVSAQASDPIKDELTPVLHADSSLDSKQEVSSGLGRALLKQLAGDGPDPTVPPQPRRAGGLLGKVLPPAGPPPIPPPRRRFVLPPEFKTGAWKE
jgi:hypothetical protein